jgi:hypothetical protein
MAKREDEIGALRDELAGLRQLLAQHGIILPEATVEPRQRPDYIEPGSPAHAVFLGLVSVPDDASEESLRGYTTYVSEKTGVRWRLEDEIGAVAHYPGVDPDKAAILVLRQKINSLESGPPQVQNAPPPMAPYEGSRERMVLIGSQ